MPITARVVLMSLLLAGTAAATGIRTLYQAQTGSVTPEVQVSMTLSPSGTATFLPNLSGCSIGQVCAFAGAPLDYALPDGSTASLTDLGGTFAPLGGESYGITGKASGKNSLGQTVHVKVSVTMTITCRSGRGGGCTKTYVDGALSVTVRT